MIDYWTDERQAQLRNLWATGCSTAEIGRRIGTSKNAVIGKAHRLHLPERPSPIQPAGSGSRPGRWARRRPRAPKITLPTMAEQPQQPGLNAVLGRSKAPEVSQHPAPSQTPPAPRIWPPPTRHQPHLPCCWPIGDPGTWGFHFCDAKALPGKPYCSEHAQSAYVRVREAV